MNFTKGVERLINPIDVGSLHFIQFFNKFLPKFIQDALVQSSARSIPYMGFVVEPYATFLCYEIEDVAQAKALLPKGFDLIKTRIFTDDQPKYYCIFGCFTAHTSAFWGSRVELYVIAEDAKTGLLSWIIVDYDSNTISYDTRDGLRSPNSSAIVTTNYEGTVYVDVGKNDQTRAIAFQAQTPAGKMKKLDQRLWLEGNLSIGYGSNFGADDAHVFSLKFEPAEVVQALEIPTEAVSVDVNSWYPGLCQKKVAKVVCFPYAQHFVSDSPGASSTLKNKAELVKAVKEVDFKNIQVFSTQSLKRMFLVGSALSFLMTLGLVILLIVKW